jgi:hypothetical protein
MPHWNGFRQVHPRCFANDQSERFLSLTEILTGGNVANIQVCKCLESNRKSPPISGQWCIISQKCHKKFSGEISFKVINYFLEDFRVFQSLYQMLIY